MFFVKSVNGFAHLSEKHTTWIFFHINIYNMCRFYIRYDFWWSNSYVINSAYTFFLFLSLATHALWPCGIHGMITVNNSNFHFWDLLFKHINKVMDIILFCFLPFGQSTFKYILWEHPYCFPFYYLPSILSSDCYKVEDFGRKHAQQRSFQRNYINLHY